MEFAITFTDDAFHSSLFFFVESKMSHHVNELYIRLINVVEKFFIKTDCVLLLLLSFICSEFDNNNNAMICEQLMMPTAG